MIIIYSYSYIHIFHDILSLTYGSAGSAFVNVDVMSTLYREVVLYAVRFMTTEVRLTAGPSTTEVRLRAGHMSVDPDGSFVFLTAPFVIIWPRVRANVVTTEIAVPPIAPFRVTIIRHFKLFNRSIGGNVAHIYQDIEVQTHCRQIRLTDTPKTT